MRVLVMKKLPRFALRKSNLMKGTMRYGEMFRVFVWFPWDSLWQSRALYRPNSVLEQH
jgi:hypothetical protein